jgi:hypothetical protein
VEPRGSGALVGVGRKVVVGGASAEILR